MKLRLLVRGDCNRSCAGCCNRSWDLENLPIAKSFRGYSEVMLTGGEPMLDIHHLSDVITQIHRDNIEVPIYLYTAKVTPSHELGWILSRIDGVTVTVHTEADVQPFLAFATYAKLWKLHKFRSLRVNVFKPMQFEAPEHWIMKANMEWIVNCPLPQDEVFMRTAVLPRAKDTNWTGLVEIK